MPKAARRAIWWSAIIIYLAIVFSTLRVAPAIWDKIDGLLDGKAIGVFYLGAALAVIGVVFFMEEVKHERKVMRYIIFFFLSAIFFYLAIASKFPAEKIHMAEYGFMGILVYNALKIELDRYDPKLYIIGAVLCASAGLLDEVIQGIVPGRYFDWKDVMMNTAGGAITLLVIRVNILRGRQGKHHRVPYR